LYANRPYDACPAVFRGVCCGGSECERNYADLLMKPYPSYQRRLLPIPDGEGFRFLGVESGSLCLLIAPYGLEEDDEVCRLSHKTVTSSAYATTGTHRLCRPILIPGSLSSSVRRRGWRHTAYNTILKGQPCRTESECRSRWSAEVERGSAIRGRTGYSAA
jgi:hypothetical protein